MIVIKESKDLEQLLSEILKLFDKNKISYSVGKKGNRIQVRKEDLKKASELSRTVDKERIIAICSLI